MGERLILNLLLSVAPVFVYQAMMFSGLLQRDSKFAQRIMGLASGLASVLCMIFPVVYGTHFLWDLRWVSFLLAVMYGGAEGGLICALMMSGYRAFLGGLVSWLIVAGDAGILFAVVLCYRRHLFKYPRGRGQLILFNTLLSAGAYAFVMATIYVYFVSRHQAEFFLAQGWAFFVEYGAITVIAHNLSVVLIESLFNQAAIQKDLQQAEKLLLVSDLAASFAHEIRNPLTVANGVLQLLSESLTDDALRHVTLAQAELDRAEETISDYLNFAKPQSEKMEPVYVGQAMEEVIRVMSPFAAMRNVSISGETDNESCILCDRKKFKQIMVNLVKNAVEANSSGGHVHVKTATEHNTVSIEVEDNGVGMDKSQLAMLGKPFYSTKTKGTGLGLMVTFRLVNMMGGKLQFTSTEGSGTTARIELPLAGVEQSRQLDIV